MGSRVTGTALALAAMIAVAGCAGAPGASTPPRAEAPSPSILCPGLEGVPAAEDCVPSDPEAAMAENESYRERGPIAPGGEADAAALVSRVTADLEYLYAVADPVTADALVAALVAAGVPADGIQTQEGSGVAFGASTSFGCIFGGVGPQGVEVAAGGGIADGGCLPAQGH